MITEPGVYDLTADEYHADPVDGGSLSSSEARLLLDSPARYRYVRDHGSDDSDDFDFGTAAHRLVLGAGCDVVIVNADNWRTKAAQTAKIEARAAGHAPVLAREWATVEAMADAVRAHPIAATLLDPTRGMAEQCIVWRDADHPDVWRRALVDLLPFPTPGRRLIVADYKTARSARADDFGRAAASFGYAEQADWYGDGVSAVLDVDQDGVAFVFIVQERHPPYLVNVIELDPTALRIGRERNRRAIDLYRQCRASGVYPGYGPDVETAALPRWVEFRHDDEMAAQNDSGASW